MAEFYPVDLDKSDNQVKQIYNKLYYVRNYIINTKEIIKSLGELQNIHPRTSNDFDKQYKETHKLMRKNKYQQVWRRRNYMKYMLHITIKKVLKQMVKYYDTYSTDIIIIQYIKTLHDAYALSELIKLQEIDFSKFLEQYPNFISDDIINAYYTIKRSEEYKEYDDYDHYDDSDDYDDYEHYDDYDDGWSEAAAAAVQPEAAAAAVQPEELKAAIQKAKGGKSRKRKSRRVKTRKMKEGKSKKRKVSKGISKKRNNRKDISKRRKTTRKR